MRFIAPDSWARIDVELPLGSDRTVCAVVKEGFGGERFDRNCSYIRVGLRDREEGDVVEESEMPTLGYGVFLGAVIAKET